MGDISGGSGEVASTGACKTKTRDAAAHIFCSVCMRVQKRKKQRAVISNQNYFFWSCRCVFSFHFYTQEVYFISLLLKMKWGMWANVGVCYGRTRGAVASLRLRVA